MKSRIAVVLLVAFTAMAHADTPDVDEAILAYNQATTGGDVESRVAAARTLGAAIIADPDHADAAVLAYEAGQSLCVYAECDGASDLAALAASRPLERDAVLPVDIALLEAYTDWRTDPGRKTRKALDSALEEAVGSDLTMLTLTAFHNRYIEDISEGDWRSAVRSAKEAQAHFEPFRQVIAEHWSDASIAAIMASFNANPDTEDVMDMAKHHVEVGKMAYATENDPEWLSRHWYLTDAWQMAMAAYFQSGGGRRLNSKIPGPEPKRIEEQVQAIYRELDDFEGSPFSRASDKDDGMGESKLPFCQGSFNMDPTLTYPLKAAREGMFGAVIARLSVEDLKVSDVEILAAVPSGTFEEEATDIISQWTWKPEKGIAEESCRTDRSNLILPMIFSLSG